MYVDKKRHGIVTRDEMNPTLVVLWNSLFYRIELMEYHFSGTSILIRSAVDIVILIDFQCLET
jgi:hypothetical protein